MNKLLNRIDKALMPKAHKQKEAVAAFFKQFEDLAKTRGCVAYFQEATETKTNRAGIVEKYAVDATTTKLVVLPGDNYSKINKHNLVAFEGLSRRFRRELEKIRTHENRKLPRKAKPN